jgi:hypothetical protein
MSAIQRFDVWDDGAPHGLEEAELGDWVRYEEHAAQLAERKEIIAEVVASSNEFRDAVLNQRHQLEEPCLDNDQTNAVLGLFDDTIGNTLSRASSVKTSGGWLPIEREQMQWLDANCYDLRCESVPSGGDDADIIWIVYSHHMSKPALRAEGYGKTAAKAIADAMLPKGDPKRWDYVPPESLEVPS